MTTDKREQILDSAEARARRGGYYGFSFRDIASDVGIKSASVHYHFPTKEALSEALAERYIHRTKAALGDPQTLGPQEAIGRVCDLFIQSNEQDDLMCLCGIFGAEVGSIPEAVIPKVGAYFEYVTNWLSRAILDEGNHDRSLAIVACLEGGLIMARTRKDPLLLRRIAEVAKNL